ncbi:MAG: homocysteine S-methyltransferase family protein [Planctomycetota bacterium]
MNPPFIEKINAGPVLFDGAIGTRLMAEGLPASTPPDAWNEERPDVLVAIHKEYLASGADVITTNSFGANPLKLSAFGLQDRCEPLNRASVRLARQALADAGRPGGFVAGDVGTTGLYFPPVGTLEESDAACAFRVQAEVLASEGVDLFLVETMTDLKEAEILVRTVREVSDLPIGATLTFDQKPRGYFTLMGDKPGDAARRLAEAGANFVGANCTLGPEAMVGLAGILVSESPVPVIVQPNAGNPELVDGRAVYRVTPEAFAASVAAILEKGVAAVGGCCGTGPAHIRAVAGLLKSR